MTLKCRHLKTRIVNITDDDGDVERTICINKECEKVIKEEVLISRPDGSEIRKSRAVASSAQPVSFNFPGGDNEEVAQPLLTAQEMMEKAIKVREETIGNKTKELTREILKACAEVVLEGEHKYLVESDREVSGEVVKSTVQELKNLGYIAKKSPVPGQGVWIEVKWKTKPKKASSKRVEKKPQESPPPKKKRGRPKKKPQSD